MRMRLTGCWISVHKVQFWKFLISPPWDRNQNLQRSDHWAAKVDICLCKCDVNLSYPSIYPSIIPLSWQHFSCNIIKKQTNISFRVPGLANESSLFQPFYLSSTLIHSLLPQIIAAKTCEKTENTHRPGKNPKALQSTKRQESNFQWIGSIICNCHDTAPVFSHNSQMYL